MKSFALLGNPNCGKTTLYNILTGSTAHVGNWPGVTVEKRSGTYKKLSEPLEIIDLPGIYSLSPYTSEEVVSRNYILEENPACIINIVDVTCIERSLYLTTQALEIDIPVIVALNMMDELIDGGASIDIKAIEEKLGVPVIPISALKGTGIHELMAKAYQVSNSPREGKLIINNKDLNHLISDVAIAFKGTKVSNPLFHAVKLVERDEVEIKEHPSLISMVDAFEKSMEGTDLSGDYEAVIADARYNYITENLKETIYSIRKNLKKYNGEENENKTKSDKIDKVLTHKWGGIPFFLLIMFAIFHLTFSENFLFLGGILQNNGVLPSFNGNEWFEGAIWTDSGINSLGLIIANIVNGFTGWISSLIEEGLGNANAPAWIQGLLCDGILGGLFAIIGFLPQILLLFLFFAILEDSGYMARVAFILDKIFRKFGLSGRAFMPMIMGFGCSVPAIVNTRTLNTEKEKEATIRVIPFFSCSAKLPVLTACAGAIACASNVSNPDIITYSMYLLGIITAIIMVLLMRNTTMRGKVPPFIMELPTYRLPKFTSLMFHLWDKAKHFIQKAFTIVLASTIVIWFFSSFKPNWQMCDSLYDLESEFVGYDISQSILYNIGALIQPLFTPVGFGSQLNGYGWVFAVAAITGLVAKENIIATLGVLAASIGVISEVSSIEGASSVYTLMQTTRMTNAGLIAFIAFNLLTIPCFAAVATAKGEIKKGRFKYTIIFWLLTSYIVSSIVYAIGSAFTYKSWVGIITILGFILLTVLVGYSIRLYNKKHPVYGEMA